MSDTDVIFFWKCYCVSLFIVFIIVDYIEMCIKKLKNMRKSYTLLSINIEIPMNDEDNEKLKYLSYVYSENNVEYIRNAIKEMVNNE